MFLRVEGISVSFVVNRDEVHHQNVGGLLIQSVKGNLERWKHSSGANKNGSVILRQTDDLQIKSAMHPRKNYATPISP